MRPKLQDLARDCFKWVCRRQQLHISDWRAELQSIKNTAYAWRQILFYLSMIEQAELNAFLDWCAHHLTEQTEDFRHRFAPAMEGLLTVARGDRFDSDGTHAAGGRRFLGWTTKRHWLRAQKTSAVSES
jgi:hypothetical protein